jgi:DNA-binding GntR family transcriptional regulator
MNTPLATQVRARLREDLLTRSLLPGQQIVQEALAERYGVSRVPLREALKELEADGLVTHEPHRGYFVTELNAAEMSEVYTIRALLEAEAIRRATPRLSDVDLAHIDELHQAFEDSLDQSDLGSIASANRAFHFAVFDACGLPRLVRLLHTLWDASDAYRSLYFQDPDTHRYICDEHLAHLEALARRDAEGAVETQRLHRERSVQFVSASLGC